jgi:CrcB protein
MSVAIWIAAGACGGLGALGRAVVDLAMGRAAGAGFPYGIAVANLTGALAAGLIVGAVDSVEAEFVIAGGFLSGYTTFSTWMLDTMMLWRDRRRLEATVNLAGSLVLGLALAAAGWAIARGMF